MTARRALYLSLAATAAVPLSILIHLILTL